MKWTRRKLTTDWLRDWLAEWMNEWMNGRLNERINGYVLRAGKYKTNAARHFSDGKQTARGGWERGRKNQEPHVPHVYAVFSPASPSPPLLLYTHFRRLSPLSRLWFGGIKVNSSQRDAMRRGAARVKPSHSSFEMPAACAAVVTALRPVATPPNSQTAHAHIEWERERAGVG